MIGLAALSSQPELAARMSLAVLLVPVAFTRHMTSLPFVALSRLRLDRLLAAAGFGEWGAHTPASAARAVRFCRKAPRVCTLYLTAVCGANPRGNLEAPMLARLMAHLPVGTAVMNMAHWSQVGRAPSASSACTAGSCLWHWTPWSGAGAASDSCTHSCAWFSHDHPVLQPITFCHDVVLL